jgi:hypothetical protein
MSEGATQLARVDITYRRDPNAPVILTLSYGAVNVVLYPAPLGGTDLLLDVIGALVRLMPYEGELTYVWWGDQAYYRWHFHLVGDVLRIEVRDWDDAVAFSAICSLRQFAAKLRLCASRLATTEDVRIPHGGDWVRADLAYRQLCAWLDARKRGQ